MNEPFLWAAIDDNGSLICWGHSRESACGGMGAAECIPLYREPTLTDAEREAVEEGIYLCEGAAGEANENINFHAWAKTAVVLRGLLERLA